MSNKVNKSNKILEIKKSSIKELLDKPVIAIKGKFSSVALARFIRYLHIFGFKLIGTNISNEEYYFKIKNQCLLDEAERMALAKFDYHKSEISVFRLATITSHLKTASSQYEVDIPNLFTQYEVLCIINSMLRNISTTANSRNKLIDELIRKGIILEIYPLHDKKCVKEITLNVRNIFIYPVGKDIIDYFGMEVAYYFEWTNFYWYALVFPSSFGLLTYFFSSTSQYDYTISSNPFTSLYAGFTIIWGFLFIKFWIRHKLDLDIEWNSIGKSKSEWDPIAELYEQEFSPSQQKLRYLLSAVILVLMLLMGFSVTIISFNLRGIVSETTQFGSSNILFIPALHRYSQKSELFDTDGPYYLVPILMHSTLIYLMNSFVFKRVAIKLTDMENHHKESDYFYFFIIKRFVFDSLDWYFGLFYLAFVELDVNKLRNTLHVLFISDVVRHIILNCVLPWLTQILKSHADRIIVSSHSRSIIILEFWNNINKRDTYMESYDSFDDYLNFVIKYGYIVLFAAVSPVTSQVAFISNLFIVKTDIIKILYLFKRPRVTIAHDTEPWVFIASVLTWSSIITNILIFAFSSDQMYYWFPKYFVPISIKQRVRHNAISEVTKYLPNPNKGIQVCGILVLLEHLFIIMGAIIYFAIPSVSSQTHQRLLQIQSVITRNQSRTTNSSSQTL